MSINIIFLVRHGVTDWNIYPKRFQGRRDIPLNTTGIQQAYALANYFKNIKIDYIISSPLRRAYQTAKIINKFHKLPIKICDQLMEMHFGHWEGKTIYEIKHKFPQLWNLWEEEPEKLRIPQAETLDDLIKRILSVIKKLSNISSGIKLIIGHGSWIRAFIANIVLKKASLFNKIPQNNAAINILYLENSKNLRLILYNFTQYLKIY